MIRLFRASARLKEYAHAIGTTKWKLEKLYKDAEVHYCRIRVGFAAAKKHVSFHCRVGKQSLVAKMRTMAPQTSGLCVGLTLSNELAETLTRFS
jgi:hypothetical protein